MCICSGLSYAQTNASDTDYAVYSAWLRQSVNIDSGVVVRPETLPAFRNRAIWYVPPGYYPKQRGRRAKSDTLHVWESQLPKVEWETVFQRYNASRGAEPLLLDKAKFTGLPAVMSGADKRYRINRVEFSRITYSADGQRALFCCAEYQTGDGEGMLVFMRREAGEWKRFFVRGLWIT